MSARFDAVGVVVRDMAATLGFYRLIGLEFAEAAESEGHVEAAGGGGVRLMFDTEEMVRSFDPAFEPPTSRGRIGLAFLCDTPAAVDATYAAIVAAGYSGHAEPFDAFWGQRYATVQDPDGNLIDLFAALG